MAGKRAWLALLLVCVVLFAICTASPELQQTSAGAKVTKPKKQGIWSGMWSSLKRKASKLRRRFSKKKMTNADTVGPIGKLREGTNKITCPALAVMYNKGWITPNKKGLVERTQLHDVITDKLGMGRIAAHLLTMYMVKQSAADALSKNHKADACMPNTKCFWKGIVSDAESTKRFISLFNHDDNSVLEHRFSCGIREKTKCSGQVPCLKRFEDRIAKFADENGIITRSVMMQNILCNCEKHPVDGNPTNATRQTAPYLAFNSFVNAFARKKYLQDDYFTVEDLRRLFIHAELPIGWEKRSFEPVWGILAVAREEKDCKKLMKEAKKREAGK